MAEKQQQMSTNDVGNVTDSSSKAQPARGVSDALVANLKINQVNLFKDLDSLIGRGRQQEGCSIGKMVKQLDKPLQNKLNEIFCNPTVDSSQLAQVMIAYGLAVSSSDVLRRHRRRLMGKEGCKCPIDNLAVPLK